MIVARFRKSKGSTLSETTLLLSAIALIAIASLKPIGPEIEGVVLGVDESMNLSNAEIEEQTLGNPLYVSMPRGAGEGELAAEGCATCMHSGTGLPGAGAPYAIAGIGTTGTSISIERNPNSEDGGPASPISPR